MTDSPAPHGPRAPDLATLRFAPEERDQGFLLHPSPTLLFDPTSRRIVAANIAAAAMYGWTRDELATMSLEDLQPPEHRSALRDGVAEEARLGGSHWHQIVQWRRDGEMIDVEVLSQPMRLDDRPVRRAMVRDVTARVRAEALFLGVAEQSLTGIYVAQDDRAVYLNARMAELFGYTVDEVLAQRDPWRFLTDDARAVAATKGQDRPRDGRDAVHYTLRAKRRDGTPVLVEVHGTTLTLHGQPATLITVLDVTERLRADAALHESERRFRAAFDQAMTAMALTASDGRWLRVNRALCDMLGYTMDELMGSTFQSVTHPEDIAPNVVLKDALLTGEIPGYRMQKRFLHRSGSIVWAELNVALVRDESGEPLYMVSQMNDVTAQKRAEIALGESEAQLRHAQKMEAVGRLAGGVAHDFNNLLTVIGSNAEMGAELSAYGEPSPEEFAEIRAAVDRAASLTRQLLAFSRRQVLAPAPLSLNEVVRDAERMLHRVIGEDIVIETRLDPRAGDVVADRGQLEQVLMNLVVNARDAMRDGGRVVIATHADQEGEVSVSVTDTGSGMDAATQARAFEPFFTTKEPGKGTGLGLSTVYGIAQQSDGRVTIRSAPGEGTTVTLILPSCRTAAPAAGECSASGGAGRPGAAEGATILLVEDEAGVRAVARRILTRFGYRVIEAKNGAEALVQWDAEGANVRLVLTDAVMPVMGGREMVERLRLVGADVPVLYMSGYADGERGGEVPSGANLIGKPFSAESLVERIAAMLQASSGNRTASPAPRPH